MAKYKDRVVYKCFDSLVANKTESLRNKELQHMQERETKLKELHEQMLQHAAASVPPVSPSSPATTVAVGPQIIIVPDPDLLKEIQTLKNAARVMARDKKTQQYQLSRNNSRKALSAWTHRATYGAWNTWRGKLKQERVFRRVVARHM